MASCVPLAALSSVEGPPVAHKRPSNPIWIYEMQHLAPTGRAKFPVFGSLVRPYRAEELGAMFRSRPVGPRYSRPALRAGKQQPLPKK